MWLNFHTTKSFPSEKLAQNANGKISIMWYLSLLERGHTSWEQNLHLLKPTALQVQNAIPCFASISEAIWNLFHNNRTRLS